MTSKPPIPVTDATTCSPEDYRRRSSSCWGAVLAGTLTVLGILLILTTLGVAYGLAPFRSGPGVQPAAIFSTGAAMVWSLFAIVALSFGGWAAGRISGCPRKGVALGFLVWSLALVVTLPWLVLGISLKLSRAAKPH